VTLYLVGNDSNCIQDIAVVVKSHYGPPCIFVHKCRFTKSYHTWHKNRFTEGKIFGYLTVSNTEKIALMIYGGVKTWREK